MIELVQNAHAVPPRSFVYELTNSFLYEVQLLDFPIRNRTHDFFHFYHDLTVRTDPLLHI